MPVFCLSFRVIRVASSSGDKGSRSGPWKKQTSGWVSYWGTKEWVRSCWSANRMSERVSKLGQRQSGPKGVTIRNELPASRSFPSSRHDDVSAILLRLLKNARIFPPWLTTAFSRTFFFKTRTKAKIIRREIGEMGMPNARFIQAPRSQWRHGHDRSHLAEQIIPHPPHPTQQSTRQHTTTHFQKELCSIVT